MANPYSSKPEHNFWRPAIADRQKQDVIPFADKTLSLCAQNTISTAGSCFAQNLAKYLKRENLVNFLEVEEVRDGQPLFSAHYGNIYTSRQLLQLIKRAIDNQIDEHHHIVQNKDQKYFDLYRPYVFPEGFESIEKLVQERNAHLKAVIEVFKRSDVFVFTLGLTECWVSNDDGTVYPACPDAIFPETNTLESSFQNFTYQECLDDLVEAIELISLLNPAIKILLTVSPVPLTATYTENHILTATCHSKSILRAVCSAVTLDHDHVFYFPSYEIITSPYHSGSYFKENCRSVTDEGIEHVMAVFTSTLFPKSYVPPITPPSTSIFDDGDDEVLCDEDESMKSIGF